MNKVRSCGILRTITFTFVCTSCQLRISESGEACHEKQNSHSFVVAVWSCDLAGDSRRSRATNSIEARSRISPRRRCRAEENASPEGFPSGFDLARAGAQRRQGEVLRH